MNVKNLQRLAEEEKNAKNSREPVSKVAKVSRVFDNYLFMLLYATTLNQKANNVHSNTVCFLYLAFSTH